MWSYLVGRLKGTSQTFAYLGIIGGFVADVLQPLAPFTNYLFFLASFSVAVTGVIMVVAISLRDKIFPFFVLSVSAMIFSAAIMFFHNENNTKSGVLAGVIPGVETLQSSLGIIKKDLASIKKSTTEIEQTVKTNLEETQKVGKKVDESTKQIIKSIEKLQKELSEDISEGTKEQISKSIAKLQKDLEGLSENLSEVLSEEEQKRNEWKVSEIPSALPRCKDNEEIWNDCQGAKKYENGDSYAGEWKNNLRHGKGTYRFANGNKYVGEYEDGKWHGKGTFTTQTWEAQYPPNSLWKNGYWVDPNLAWKTGDTSSSLPDCLSTYGNDYWVWTNCFGAYPWQDGTSYAGEWKNGKFHGTGTLTLSYDGDKYVGEFVSGMRHGKGTYYSANGNTQGEKLWKNGKMVSN
ncbi:MAG: hypothetical protein VYC15_01830 [Pseudomonadota bacterium]|nr:hypothetical protein [Pseudomonadota bacterium]